jgi:WD40 repeat protein
MQGGVYDDFEFSPDSRLIRELDSRPDPYPDQQRDPEYHSGRQDIFHIWSASDGRRLAIIEDGHGIATSPDWSLMATHDPRRDPVQTRIWRVETGEALLTLDGEVQVVFSPDGRRMATLASDGLKLWRIEYD